MEILNLKDDSLSNSADSSGLKFSKKTKRILNPLQVTDLRAAVKDTSRVNVFLGGKFAFSLTLAQVTDLGIKIGNIYTEAELEKIKSASNFGKLYQLQMNVW